MRAPLGLPGLPGRRSEPPADPDARHTAPSWLRLGRSPGLQAGTGGMAKAGPASETAGEAAAPPSPGLFGDLLDRFTEIVGPAASEATFHFASFQEGIRMATGNGPRDLAAALARIDGAVGHRSRIVEDGGSTVRIAVTGSALLSSGNPVRQAVVRGLVEGALRAVRGRAYTGRILPDAGPEVLLEFTPEVPGG